MLRDLSKSGERTRFHVEPNEDGDGFRVSDVEGATGLSEELCKRLVTKA